ncbi:DUF397 domain-containing protein [Streptomyces sp. NPDC058417]|uniref:DUF397 domain-containing protein n=1 Tax=unclassified Streptomyces TaxID=2593676 RepID=UPI003646ED4F
MNAETPSWFSSSYSNNGGACVVVATNLAGSLGAVPVRDSKCADGPVLTLAAAPFAVFVSCLKNGEWSP